MSRPASPTTNENDGVDALQSFASPPMNRFRMLSVCLINFGNGLSDSAPGALIPYIEKHILPPVEMRFSNIFSDITALDMRFYP